LATYIFKMMAEEIFTPCGGKTAFGMSSSTFHVWANVFMAGNKNCRGLIFFME